MADTQPEWRPGPEAREALLRAIRREPRIGDPDVVEPEITPPAQPKREELPPAQPKQGLTAKDKDLLFGDRAKKPLMERPKSGTQSSHQQAAVNAFARSPRVQASIEAMVKRVQEESRRNAGSGTLRPHRDELSDHDLKRLGIPTSRSYEDDYFHPNGYLKDEYL